MPRNLENSKIIKVANIISSYKKNYKVIVVSSAMSGVTNDLVNKSKEAKGNQEWDTFG